MDSETQDRIRNLPCWTGSIEITPLKGGLVNQSWIVEDGAGRHVVRCGSDFPFHHVIRDREIMTARAAHKAGFGPSVEFSEPGIMVSTHISARRLEAHDIRAQIATIAPLLRRFHNEMPKQISGVGFMFWVFHIIRDYARTLENSESRFREDLPGFLQLAETLEHAQIALPVIFGHNDLLPSNFLDDGERLWLVDYEYSGFSTAMFDLGNLSSNADFSWEESEELLRLYFGAAPSPETRKALAAMQCASLLREAMWSMVSELHLSNAGVDYEAYTQYNLERLDRALDQYLGRYGD